MHQAALARGTCRDEKLRQKRREIMTLDPDSGALIARLRELQLPRYETLSPEEARAAMAASRKAAAVQPPEIFQTQDFEIPINGHAVKARLYRPVASVAPLPMLVFFHGGGWVLGDLESHDILCRRLANAAGYAVLSVEYRLAPESKFPAALDDAIAATNWVFDNATRLNVDPRRVAVGGDSAGANLAAVVAHLARDAGAPLIRLQLLIYPVVDLYFGLPSHQLKEDALPVLGETMIWFRDHYLSDPAQRGNWRASPLLAENFSGLPPAYVVTAGYDPLADEGRAYADKLASSGVTVKHRHYPGQIHGFLTMGVAFPTTESAVAEIGEALRRAAAI
jgi:acetyl esterase